MRSVNLIMTGCSILALFACDTGTGGMGSDAGSGTNLVNAKGAPNDSQGAPNNSQGAPNDSQGAPNDSQTAPNNSQPWPPSPQGSQSSQVTTEPPPESDAGTPGDTCIPAGNCTNCGDACNLCKCEAQGAGQPVSICDTTCSATPSGTCTPTDGCAGCSTTDICGVCKCAVQIGDGKVTAADCALLNC